MSKEILRKRLINLRKTKYTNQSISYVQLKKILKRFKFKKNLIIGGYYPINNEIGSLEILKKLENNNFRISLPITQKKNIMNFYEWSFKDPLRSGQRGIPEPYKKNKVLPDILLVPLVGFDKNKFRLGYGGGFYDRYISKLSKLKNVLTIGFAFPFQEIEKIPVNKFDQQLDFILTNKRIIR